MRAPRSHLPRGGQAGSLEAHFLRPARIPGAPMGAAAAGGGAPGAASAGAGVAARGWIQRGGVRSGRSGCALAAQRRGGRRSRGAGPTARRGPALIELRERPVQPLSDLGSLVSVAPMSTRWGRSTVALLLLSSSLALSPRAQAWDKTGTTYTTDGSQADVTDAAGVGLAGHWRAPATAMPTSNGLALWRRSRHASQRRFCRNCCKHLPPWRQPNPAPPVRRACPARRRRLPA